MSRPRSALALSILKHLDKNELVTLHGIYKAHPYAESNKSLYNAVYRLTAEGLITLGRSGYTLTPEGVQVIHKFFPKKDGIWKIVIFDIPERKREVRTILRSRLQALNFKRWQNSIWISPYELSQDIELELAKLAERYFIRLIKTTDINYTADLKKLFPY